MNKTILRSLLFALMGVLALDLRAEPAWTTGSCAPADWTALAGNVLSNVVGTSTATGVSGYASLDLAVLTDGSVPTTTPDKDGIFGFRNSENVSWTFAAPKTIEQIRISTCYLGGAAYDGVHVSKVEAMFYGGSSWEEIAGDCEYKGESTAGKINSIVLDNGDDPVAQNIVGLKVTFGTCETGFANYYAEIEAVGAAGALGPAIGAFDIVPAKTKATISGSIADVGTDATACDVYLALDGGAATKIAAGVTNSFAYQIRGLTAGTEYAYELSVSNNAPTAKGTVRSGTFTTLAENDPTAVWTTGTYMPLDWTALENNVLANVRGTMDLSHQPNNYGTNDLIVLSDGYVPSEPGKDWIVGIQQNAEIAWELAEPVALERLRISSCYLEDPHFSGVNISSVMVKCEDSDEWVAVLGSSSDKVVGDGSTKNIVCATLSDAETGYLARNVTDLKVVFGPAVYVNANYYAEIEAVGQTERDKDILVIVVQ